MTLRDLRYLLALAEHRHFGKAAAACHVSQPTLSGQIKKLEAYLGVALFERTNKWVVPTAIGERILARARIAVAASQAIEAEARAARDPLSGPLRLGAIPTLAPYLMPLILGPLRGAYPRLDIWLWEDITANLLDRLLDQKLDAVLIATPPGGDLVDEPLFCEPFLAVLPERHRLTTLPAVSEADLASDLLVLADGHCLSGQVLAACQGTDTQEGRLRAASLETLVNLVCAGHGTTLIPGLAAGAVRGRGLVLRPLVGGLSRTVRLVSRPTFAGTSALAALGETIRTAVGRFG